jgi:Na+-driven multidrug efflux pump
MSVNILVDTIFVGQWIGSLAIAAVTVVLPITFFVRNGYRYSGGSVLSRALGAKTRKAKVTFANQIMMTFFLASLLCYGHFFYADMLLLFGARAP